MTREDAQILSILESYLLAQRQAMLSQVDAIEVMLGMERTSEIRKEHKRRTNRDNVSYTHEGVE
jgi:hypothetical protein